MKMICLFLFLGSAIFLGLSLTPSARFDRFVKRAMMVMTRSDPEWLSNLGMETRFDFFSNQLTDISYQKNIERLAEIKKLLSHLHCYNREQLPFQGQITFDLLSLYLKEILNSASFDYGSYEVGNTFNPYPVNQLFGVQNVLSDFFMNIHRVTDPRSEERYIARLSQWRKKFNDLIAELKLREQKGVILPRFLIQKVIEESKDFIRVPPQQNMLYMKVATRRIAKKALETVSKTVYPAYLDLISFLEGQINRASDDAGVWKFPNGSAYYAECLKFHTTTDDCPETVHALGLAEVARIQGEMRQILDRLGFENSSIKEAMRHLSQDPRFLYPDTDQGRKQILADYRKILEEIQEKLAQLFIQLPKAPLKLEAVPDFKAKSAPFAYYEPGDLKGERPGVFYINTYDLHNQTKFTMPSLAYHEGLPGHHLQMARAYEIENLPLFRKVVTFNAYVEGWALYCEQLASEFHFTDAIHADLGRLQFELMRAARLVVDTGLHHKRWTRNQAIQYMLETTGQNENEIAIEVDRYIVLPGQACSYKIGMIKLLELREKMRAQMGADFDIRVFHELVLEEGALPLSLLENLLINPLHIRRSMEGRIQWAGKRFNAS